jgi:tripartite-type tricarboxylate transporter receptor subunit TctC
VWRLNTEINRVLASAAMRERLQQSHNLPAPGNVEAFEREIELDRQRNTALVARDPRAFD